MFLGGYGVIELWSCGVMEGMRGGYAPFGNPSEKLPALPKKIVSLRPIKVAHF